MVRFQGCLRSTDRLPISTIYVIASRTAFRAVLISFLMAMVMMFGVASSEANMRKDKLTLVTAAGQHVIDIEIAQTLEEKALGLMYRRNVPMMTGMLFPYDGAQELTMWMKNTYAHLDMIFIRGDGVVHRIEARTEPLSERTISSGGAVTAVLELGAGEAARLGLKPGDKVLHSHFGTAKR